MATTFESVGGGAEPYFWAGTSDPTVHGYLCALICEGLLIAILFWLRYRLQQSESELA